MIGLHQAQGVFQLRLRSCRVSAARFAGQEHVVPVRCEGWLQPILRVAVGGGRGSKEGGGEEQQREGK